MNILFACHRLPYPPKRGGKIRPFNMIRHLARNHRVTVVTLARSELEYAEGEGLRQYCHALHVGRMRGLRGWGRFALNAFTALPSTFGYFHSRSLFRIVSDLLMTTQVDAIVVHSSSMGPYVARHDGCGKVMDFGDADSEKWFEYGRRAPFPLSVGFALEGIKVRRYERWLGQRFHACSVISPREQQVLEPIVGKPVEVIPNGVDRTYFVPRAREAWRRHPLRLVFTGNMSYRPNVDAVKHLVAEILPRIWRSKPQVELYIVGMSPVPAIRRLAGERVVVTGKVDDVRPHLESAAVAVAPLRMARGLQNKVLEAMAMRVPVVVSPAAFHGVQAVAGRDLLVAEDPDAFARAVVTLLDDASARERMAEAGRASVEQNHDWDRLLDRLEDLVTGVGGGSRSSERTSRPSFTGVGGSGGAAEAGA